MIDRQLATNKNSNNNTKVRQELISKHQAIGVFTIVSNQSTKTPRLLDVFLDTILQPLKFISQPVKLFS